MLFTSKNIYIYNENVDCNGFLNYLTKLETVKLIAFLADVLFVFNRFQKQLQSDKLTLIRMNTHISSIRKTLEGMINVKLPGGFENNLSKQLVHEEENGKISLKSIELQPACASRRSAISFKDVRVKILEALENFLTERFVKDDKLLDAITPFVSFNKDANIEEIHSLLAPDISLPNLYVQFNDFSNGADAIKEMNLNDIILKLSKTVESRSTYKELITVLARISACTPHSSDVERLISANNRLKTKQRSRISIQTENRYMYNVHSYEYTESCPVESNCCGQNIFGR